MAPALGASFTNKQKQTNPVCCYSCYIKCFLFYLSLSAKDAKTLLSSADFSSRSNVPVWKHAAGKNTYTICILASVLFWIGFEGFTTFEWFSYHPDRASFTQNPSVALKLLVCSQRDIVSSFVFLTTFFNGTNSRDSFCLR